MPEGFSENVKIDKSSGHGRRAAEQAARLAYGRLLASLCQQGATISEAEDALGDAFVRAIDRWSSHGVPDAPEAWLLTTARRVLIDRARHAAVATRAQSEFVDQQPPAQLVSVMEQMEQEPGDLRERRLELMMLCAHPEIAANARAPLMLQTVLGLTAQKMSAAFLVSPSTLGQRLARAKKSIRSNKLNFEIPPKEERETRVHDVLDAIYAAFGTAYETVNDAKNVRQGLAHEAIWLAQILVHELKDVAEAHGLLSLMLFVQARVDARRSDSGEFVPLSRQDRALWDRRLIVAAEHHLGKAAKLKKPGRFQVEAAIQSHHTQFDPATGPDWQAICSLYDVLVVRAPTLAAWVGRAAAIGEARGAGDGIDALDVIPEDLVADFQSYWAVKAHLLGQLKRNEAAEAAYNRAIGLCEDEAVRSFLLQQKDRLVN